MVWSGLFYKHMCLSYDFTWGQTWLVTFRIQFLSSWMLCLLPLHSRKKNVKLDSPFLLLLAAFFGCGGVLINSNMPFLHGRGRKKALWLKVPFHPKRCIMNVCLCASGNRESHQLHALMRAMCFPGLCARLGARDLDLPLLLNLSRTLGKSFTF